MIDAGQSHAGDAQPPKPVPVITGRCIRRLRHNLQTIIGCKDLNSGGDTTEFKEIVEETLRICGVVDGPLSKAGVYLSEFPDDQHLVDSLVGEFLCIKHGCSEFQTNCATGKSWDWNFSELLSVAAIGLKKLEELQPGLPDRSVAVYFSAPDWHPSVSDLVKLRAAIAAVRSVDWPTSEEVADNLFSVVGLVCKPASDFYVRAGLKDANCTSELGKRAKLLALIFEQVDAQRVDLKFAGPKGECLKQLRRDSGFHERWLLQHIFKFGLDPDEAGEGHSGRGAAAPSDAEGMIGVRSGPRQTAASVSEGSRVDQSQPELPTASDLLRLRKALLAVETDLCAYICTIGPVADATDADVRELFNLIRSTCGPFRNHRAATEDESDSTSDVQQARKQILAGIFQDFDGIRRDIDFADSLNDQAQGLYEKAEKWSRLIREHVRNFKVELEAEAESVASSIAQSQLPLADATPEPLQREVAASDAGRQEASPAVSAQMAEHETVAEPAATSWPTGQTKATKRKRSARSSTKKESEAQLKCRDVFLLHHKYEPPRAGGGNDSLMNLEPIGVRELAREAEVVPDTASAFFERWFERHEKYVADLDRGAVKTRLMCRQMAGVPVMRESTSAALHEHPDPKATDPRDIDLDA